MICSRQTTYCKDTTTIILRFGILNSPMAPLLSPMLYISPALTGLHARTPIYTKMLAVSRPPL